LLVVAPDPVQAFAGANYTQDQQFRLEPDSGLVLVDWFTAGRAACGERWAFERFQSRNAVWYGPREAGSAPDFLDSVRLSHGSLTARHRLGRFDCVAMLVMLGTPVRDVASQMLEQIAALPVFPRAGLVRSASAL
jgi:urease accessory protein